MVARNRTPVLVVGAALLIRNGQIEEDQWTIV